MQDSINLENFISHALNEDIGDGDHTSLACVPADELNKAELLVKDSGILAGVEVAEQIFRHIDPELSISFFLSDGVEIKPGDIAFEVSGNARSILKAERLVLNCMQRMSGIATATARYVRLVSDYKCKVLDTRKTTPGFRELEKWAVRIGGGVNHRFGLYDMIMIKDNHIDYAGGIPEAIKRTKNYLNETKRNLKIEVEARNLGEVEQIIAAGGVHRIMLDNFTPEGIKVAIDLIQGRCETEASGGITEETIANYAASGVDFISVGALTHQVKSLDLSLKAIP
ncbi:MAG: carboxylating nicotinate-nucleotide diphosphorylase [Vicingaceae bacterium]